MPSLHPQRNYTRELTQPIPLFFSEDTSMAQGFLLDEEIMATYHNSDRMDSADSVKD
jgi:hypothetical protein